ncbi:MAG: hypothetical protein ACO3JG_14020 [Luteolibacter sp.]
MIAEFISRFLGWWVNLPILVRLLLLVLLCGGLFLLAGKPVHRQIQSWRVERNLDQARQALESGQMQKARDHALAVLRTGDQRLETVRIFERATASLNDPRHSDIARLLIEHPESSMGDRLTAFLALVDRIPQGLVGQVWGELPADCRSDARFATAFAGRLTVEGRHAEASRVLLAVPEGERDAACEQALVRVLIANGSKKSYEEAQRRIAAAFPAARDELPAWLELLESIPPLGLQPGLLRSVRQVLAEEDGGRAALMIVRMDYSGRFAERGEIIDEAIRSWRDREPLELARFLAALGLHERMLEVFPDVRAAAEAGIGEFLLEAARAAGDWPRLEALLDAKPPELSRLQELAWRAVIAAQGMNAGGRAEAWSAAMNEALASRADDAYLQLHRMALAMGMEDEARQALLAAIRTGRGPLPLYGSVKPLLSALAEQANERAIIEVISIYLAFEPANSALVTQYAYYACINDLLDPDGVLQKLEPLVRVLPDEIPLQFTLALAHLCNGRPDLAASVLDPLKADVSGLPTQFRAIHLVTQLRNGRIGAGDPALRALPWSELLPSERRVFERLLRNAPQIER